MADVVKVIDAGPGWTRVQTSDGEIVTIEGNRNWRNNNPGNIEYGPFAQSMGAVGTDGRFAVFPSYDAGRSAKENLIFDSPNYRELTLAEAISRYAPPVENNTQSYINQVSGAAGIPPSTTMASIPPALRPVILDTMQKVEGWREGTRNGVPVPPRDIPNVVGTQLSVTPPRIAPTPASVEDRVTARNTAPQPVSALQAALDQYATRERNRVTPASVEDRVTARNSALARQDATQDAARRATLTMNQSYVGQDRSSPTPNRSLFSGDPGTPAAGRVVATIPSNGGPSTSIRPSVPVNTGSSSTNIANARAEQAVQRVSIPRPTSPATVQAPATAARMNDIGSMPSFSAMSGLSSGMPSTQQILNGTGFRGGPISTAPDRLTPGLPTTIAPPPFTGNASMAVRNPIGTGAVLPTIPRPAIAPTVARTAPTPFARPAFSQPAIASSIPRALPSIAPQPILRQPVAPVQSPLTIRVVGSNTIPYPQPKPQTITNQQRLQNGRDAVSQSGDTSVGNQREAAEARSSGAGGRTRRY